MFECEWIGRAHGDGFEELECLVVEAAQLLVLLPQLVPVLVQPRDPLQLQAPPRGFGLLITPAGPRVSIGHEEHRNLGCVLRAPRSERGLGLIKRRLELGGVRVLFERYIIRAAN